MKTMKKVLAGVLSLAMIASLTACGGSTTPQSTTAPVATTAPAADQPAAVENDTPAVEVGDAKISFSWWGGDTRHTATLQAVEDFMGLHPGIVVDTKYAAWTGWEDTMATQFFAGTAPDVNQINWNWIYSFGGDGTTFADLNQYSNIIDLDQYNADALAQCTEYDKLEAIPVSMTGRVFYWNKATFEKAGIATPTSLAELYAAADTFKSALGDDYYPLVLGEYDKAILLVYYLESKYGKPWVVDNTLNYTVEEITEGLKFFDELEDKGVIPTQQTLIGDGADSLDKNPKWIEGKYAGIFEWDSSASKFQSSLAEGQDFIVGDYFKDMGDYQGGFAKVSLALAITNSSPYKEQSAMLIEYLVNDDAGTAVMGSERGIPLSAKALANTSAKGLLDELVLEANAKVLAWVQFPLDPKFEDAKLKNNPEGVYYDVFSGLSYDDYSAEEAAQILADGVTSVLNS